MNEKNKGQGDSSDHTAPRNLSYERDPDFTSLDVNWSTLEIGIDFTVETESSQGLPLTAKWFLDDKVVSTLTAEPNDTMSARIMIPIPKKEGEVHVVAVNVSDEENIYPDRKEWFFKYVGSDDATESPGSRLDQEKPPEKGGRAGFITFLDPEHDTFLFRKPDEQSGTHMRFPFSVKAFGGAVTTWTRSWNGTPVEISPNMESRCILDEWAPLPSGRMEWLQVDWVEKSGFGDDTVAHSERWQFNSRN